DLYLIEDWEKFGLRILETSRKNGGRLQIYNIGTIEKILVELQANKDKVLDFDKRVQGTPLEFLSANKFSNVQDS
ncbi:MAG: hypothetical protein PUP93_27420, partial [Rhizonema sp. NSF051]|nr:hypothetical protein [Rhizonema sp. NSF051]